MSQNTGAPSADFVPPWRVECDYPSEKSMASGFRRIVDVRIYSCALAGIALGNTSMHFSEFWGSDMYEYFQLKVCTR
jgi:hypothetical protein